MSKSNIGKIILVALALIATVASVVLVIIYASLAVDVIGYISSAEKEGAEGLGAAVGLIVMVVVGAGMVVLAILQTVLFAISRRMTGGVRLLATIAFLYHVTVVILAIVTLVVIKILS